MAEIDVNGLIDKIERLAFQAGLNHGLAAGGTKPEEVKPEHACTVKHEFGCNAEGVRLLRGKINGFLNTSSECSDGCVIASYQLDRCTRGVITFRDFKELAGILAKVAELM